MESFGGPLMFFLNVVGLQSVPPNLSCLLDMYGLEHCSARLSRGQASWQLLGVFSLSFKLSSANGVFFFVFNP